MRLVMMAAVGCMVAGSAWAQVAGTVGSREGNEQSRIDNGVQSGQLTHRETSNLQGRQDAINSTRAHEKAASGGTLTNREQNTLLQRQNSLSKSIRTQKHDTQTAPSQPPH